MNNLRLTFFFIIFFFAVSFTLMDNSLEAHSFSFFKHDSLSLAGSTPVPDSLISDSILTAARDSLTPIYTKGFLSAVYHGTIIKKEKFQKDDYRYAGDLFKYSLPSFVYDLGWLGQPNEISFYGKGFQNVSYIIDGINFNSRITNSFDLYKIQSESIDSMEIIPLAKGFLYGSYNNPVAVSIYTNDTVSFTPHSRIRYFQAPDDEIYFDASFSAYLMSRINFSFEMTNSTISSRFDNGAYGGWRVSSKLRYMLSNKINFVAGYKYVKTETQLNGGAAAENKEEINFDNLLSSVFYPTSSNFSSRYQKYNQHNFYLKLLANVFEGVKTDISFYYLFDNTEFRQNERTSIKEIPVIINDNEFKTAGVSLKQDLSFSIFRLQFLSNFESTKFNAGFLYNGQTINNFSFGGSAMVNLLNGMLVPSFFTKYLKYDNSNSLGTGADVNFKITPTINLYGGYSAFERQNSLFINDINNNPMPPVQQNINTFEAGIKLYDNFIYGSASFFNTKNDNDLFYTIDKTADTLLINEASGYFTKGTNIGGINANINLRFWKLFVSANSTYYFNHDKEKLSLPEFTFFGGVYYIDTLFKTNLKLKAGINFYINGSQNYFTYDFQRNLQIQYANTGSSITLINNEVSDISYQLDLFVAGQFQDSAILYITFENVLGKDYYFVPYFPKQPRSLRFGISWDFLN